MIMIVYSIRDKKTELYQPPFVSNNDATAIRSFKRALEQPDTLLALHPKDFELFCVGTFQDTTGEIQPYDKTKVFDGDTYLKDKQNAEAIKLQSS